MLRKGVSKVPKSRNAVSTRLILLGLSRLPSRSYRRNPENAATPNAGAVWQSSGVVQIVCAGDVLSTRDKAERCELLYLRRGAPLALPRLPNPPAFGDGARSRTAPQAPAPARARSN